MYRHFSQDNSVDNVPQNPSEQLTTTEPPIAPSGTKALTEQELQQLILSELQRYENRIDEGYCGPIANHLAEVLARKLQPEAAREPSRLQ